MHPTNWRKAQPAWDYLWALIVEEPTYGWWTSGDVPAGAPAWGDNSPPPAPEDVGQLFCAAVGNLMIRALEMFDEGYVIPGEGYPQYDGGTVGWKAYYESYGTLEPFDQEFASNHSGTVCLREFRDAWTDQGHWAVSWKGWCVQSFPSAGSLEPGLNWDYTISQSQASRYGGEYEYMVKPWNWLPITKEEYFGVDESLPDETPPTPEDPVVLTVDMLVEAMTSQNWSGPDLDRTDAERYFQPLVTACRAWVINTRARLSAFLAQVGTESGSFKWWREFGRGEGKPFGIWYGRGPMQLTWEENYRRFQEATVFTAHSSPEIVADDPVVGFESAAWYWRNGNGDLNELADTATWQSFYEITGRVWGQAGPFAERDARYDHAWKVLPENLVLPDGEAAPPPPPIPPDPPEPISAALDPISARWGYYRYESDESWNLIHVPAPKEDTKETAQ